MRDPKKCATCFAHTTVCNDLSTKYINCLPVRSCTHNIRGLVGLNLQLLWFSVIAGIRLVRLLLHADAIASPSASTAAVIKRPRWPPAVAPRRRWCLTQK